MPVTENGGNPKMKSFGGVDQARLALALSKDIKGDVLEVTATGLNSGVASANFGVTYQGLFYPGVAVQVVPRDVGGKSELLKPGDIQNQINYPSIFVVQWVGYPKNAKDIMVGEVLRYPNGKITLHVLSGTDLGRYENGVLIHTPQVVPTRPNRPPVDVWERSIENIETLAPESCDITMLQARMARMLVLASEWKIKLNTIKDKTLVAEHFVE